jgi:hypothetical protein
VTTTETPLDLDAAENAFGTMLQLTPCACPVGDDDGPTTALCLAATAAFDAGCQLIVEVRSLRARVENHHCGGRAAAGE